MELESLRFVFPGGCLALRELHVFIELLVPAFELVNRLSHLETALSEKRDGVLQHSYLLVFLHIEVVAAGLLFEFSQL